MKKVLFVNHNMHYGGAQRVLINLLKGLVRREDLKITLFLLENDGAFLDEVPPEVEVRFLSYSLNRIFREKRYSKLPMKLGISVFRRILGDDALCKVVQKFLINELYSVQVAVKEGISKKMVAYAPRGVKKVFWVHTDLRKFRRKLKDDSLYYGTADQIICVSGEVKQGFLEVHPQLHDRTCVVRNIVDKEGILEKSNEGNPFDHDCINVVNVGRLSKEKAQERLIRAHKNLIDEGHYHKLHIVGEGEERSALEALIKELNLENTVTLWGAQRNPYPFIRNADLYVHSSENEGLPTVLFEAMCLNVPLVSTDASGVREVLDDGKYGLIVHNHFRGLLSGYRQMLIDEDLREHYSRATQGYKGQNRKNLELFSEALTREE